MVNLEDKTMPYMVNLKELLDGRVWPFIEGLLEGHCPIWQMRSLRPER